MLEGKELVVDPVPELGLGVGATLLMEGTGDGDAGVDLNKSLSAQTILTQIVYF